MIRADEKQGLNIDFGLTILYDGKRNTLLYPNMVREYPVGGLITEFLRLDPTEIKAVIMECSNLSAEATPDNMASFIGELQIKLLAHFDPVIAIMILSEIHYETVEWFDAIRTGRTEEFLGALNSSMQGAKSLIEFIFDGTGYKELGMKTVCQMALSAYFSFSVWYIYVKYTFHNTLSWEEMPDSSNEKAVNLLLAMYSDKMDFQYIDFRIILTENSFESMYTIKSPMSLLVFEMAHVFSQNVALIKCKNCGHYFVPDGRSDQIYCLYPSPQNKERTCREIGAQITRANKEKNDVVTREYRKVYMRYQMLTKRHPENREASKSFDKLTDGMRQWRKDLTTGASTVDQFLEWLKEF